MFGGGEAKISPRSTAGTYIDHLKNRLGATVRKYVYSQQKLK